MKTTVVLNVVGLCENVLGEHMPRLSEFARSHGQFTIRPAFPALTASSQSTYLTGLTPSGHGAVGNGWYFKELAQAWLWRQSNHLVHGEKLWDAARRREPTFTCANLFWWFNMYSSVDYSVTPRPIYRSDGLKLPDLHTEPPALREQLQARLGAFPLFNFWGPGADHRSTEWIAAAARDVFERHRPTLTLVYLPHLDYCLQREGPGGPSIPAELRRIDGICGGLIDHFRERGARVVLLSEYGINGVSGDIPVNRALRRNGWIRTRLECGEEHLDAGASDAFAVADHQIAHVYVRDPAALGKVRALLEATDGIESILDRGQQEACGIAHARSGDLVAVSRMDRWFSYPYWMDDDRAPDFARTVDIHRKPGYDPAELFLDPGLRFPRLRMAGRLLQKMLGFRYRMDVIPLDASLVKGSHGRSSVPSEYMPVLLTDTPGLVADTRLGPIEAGEIKEILLRHVFEQGE